MPAPVPEITQWLVRWRDGDKDALDGLTRLVYADLRRVAAGLIGAERPGHTLQPTALVHELYTNLSAMKPHGVDWKCRGQFFAIAAHQMRQILVDYARRRSAQKRNASRSREAVKSSNAGVLEVDIALNRLAEQHPRQALVLELRFFGGLTAEETVDAIRAQGEEVSLRTVERDWRFSKAWLQHEFRSA